MTASRATIAVLFSALAGCAQAQVTFIRTYDQPADLDLRGSCITPDDGLVLTGTSGADGFLLRLDRYGNVRWLRTYASIGADFAGTYTGEPYDEQAFKDVSALPNGDIFITGSATLDVQGALGTSMLMARFDSLGTPTWARTINSSHNESFTTTTVFNAQTAIIGGHQNTLFGASAYLYSVDLDSGDVTRSFVYDDLGTALCGPVTRSPDGAVLVTIASDVGYSVRKMDGSLATLWQGCWTMGSWNPLATQGAPNGRTIALGSSGVIRYGPSGVQEWSLPISVPSGGWSDLVVGDNGDLVLLGHTALPDPYSYLVQLDSTGAVQWTARYGAPGDTVIMTALHRLSDGSLRMVGTTGATGRPTVIAVDAQGQLDACTFPPLTVSYGSLTPTATAPGQVTTWGASATGRHEELPTTGYATSVITCAGASAGYLATGRSFVDLDQDGSPGPNEPAAPWQLVQVSPNNGGIYATSGGTYAFAPPDSGSYVLGAPLPAPLWQLSSDSASYTVHLGSLTPVADSLDFGWAPVADSTVIDAAVLPGDIPCFGTGLAIVNLLNQGTTRPDLLVAFTLDTLLSPYNPSPAPDSIVGHTLFWHVDSMALFSGWHATVSLPSPGSLFIGDTAFCTLQVFGIDSVGALLAVSSAPWESTITCAYDPNDKHVEPVGLAPWGAIDASTEWLTYTVRFQNTGNDTAQTVVIEDDLSGLLQWSTLQVLGASHELTGVSIRPTGKLVFRFDDILLPDSAADQPGSNGFVRFRVKPVPGLAHLTAIDNNAGIFFDLNPPVITNTVRNTIIDCTGIDWQASVLADFGQLVAYSYFMDTMTYTYQWLLNDVPLTGADQSYLEPQQSGDYKVVMTDAYGCSSTSLAFPFVVTIVPGNADANLLILPNPITDQARVVLGGTLDPAETATILDAQGRIVRRLRGNGTDTLLIERGDLAPGLYLLQVEGIGAVRFMVE